MLQPVGVSGSLQRSARSRKAEECELCAVVSLYRLCPFTVKKVGSALPIC